MNFIDTHSHIYSQEFEEDRDEVIQRSLEAGVDRIIMPDVCSAERHLLSETAQKYPDITYPMIGLHPTEVKDNYKKELQEIEHLLGVNKYYGIGECGLDLYWDKTYYKEQFAAFEHQLNLANDTQLPVAIHSREAIKEVLTILRKYPYIKGIVHCFSGTVEDARMAVELGYYLGIGGVVTFKKSNLPEIVAAVGISNILLETDAPYLAPVPHRGKRNESAYIPLIAQKIAEITGEDLQIIKETTTKNAVKLFNLPDIN
ncbi:MAG: TatD family hydrolase [Culturomica sp.]|jgi:TatD DNase family protein|nr:TatD family hydrolase [Culturomica sp.]